MKNIKKYLTYLFVLLLTVCAAEGCSDDSSNSLLDINNNCSEKISIESNGKVVGYVNQKSSNSVKVNPGSSVRILVKSNNKEIRKFEMPIQDTDPAKNFNGDKEWAKQHLSITNHTAMTISNCN